MKSKKPAPLPKKAHSQITLVFPDLHQPEQAVIDKMEKIVADEKPDKTVFLGDYFDQFGDTAGDARRTAEWLKQSLSDSKRIHLIGNHDASYLWPGPATVCPGYTDEKRSVIEDVLGRDAADKFQFHTWVDGWLLTHAGLASCWLPEAISLADIPAWLAVEERAAKAAFAIGQPHWFSAIGQRRGGHSPAGGLVWCDWRELEIFHVPGLRQLVGHTPGQIFRRHGQTHICLDMIFGPRVYALINDGEISIKDLGVG